MLKRLHLRNFTVFADAEFEFGGGLNVLVGTNGTGKTHVLKAGYAMLHGFLGEFRRMAGTGISYSPWQTLSGNASSNINWKLEKVFQLERLRTSELIRHGAEEKKAIVEITPGYLNAHSEPMSIILGFPSLPSSHIGSVHTFSDDTVAPLKFDRGLSYASPVFIPAKELLTLGWLLSLYDLREVPIDEIYPDTLRLLGVPPLKLHKEELNNLLKILQQLIGGKVEEEGGHFYLAAPDQSRLEMNLVAEGIRKFATLYKLLANGTLTPETTLFWDEPEANLNPALLKDMAVILTDLAQAGFQIILATHSLFLMKELHILSQQKKQPVRYFGLYPSEQGDVRVETQDNFIQLQHLVALDAELTQTYDFEDALDQEYAGDS